MSSLRPSQRGARRSPVLPIALSVGAALVAVFLAVGSATDDGGGSASDASPAQATMAGPEIRGAGALARGEADAPVVMVMYSEFQCPFCGRFARDSEPVLVDRFVEDGTLRIEWRDLPYLGPESQRAALAGRAAADQDAFWEFTEVLYADQAAPNSGALSEENLLDVAADLGLDVERFRTVMRDRATAEAVNADIDEAVSLGVNGTPSFFVNGEVIIGAQPTEVFVDAVERAAAAAP